MNLTHHCDHGLQYTSIAYNEKLADYGIKPSTGRVGDSYDNPLAEAINGLYKAVDLLPPLGITDKG